jgi:hypothetical protein
MADDPEELAALERTLLRVAMTEDEKLGPILDALLPALLARVHDAPSATRAKVGSVLFAAPLASHDESAGY